MKRIISVFLVAVLVFGLFPVTAFAASNTYVEVTKNGAPVRAQADGDSRVVYRCDEGTVLETTGSCYNWKLNKWYKVKIPGQDETLYIYSGNVKVHAHDTTKLEVNGIVYRICSCGDISTDASTVEQQNEASEVLSSTALALPLALADGPLPLGDLAAASILVLGVCFAHDYAIPAAEDLAEMISEADFDKYLEERKENTSSENSPGHSDTVQKTASPKNIGHLHAAPTPVHHCPGTSARRQTASS